MDRPTAHRSTELIYSGLSPFAQRDPETDYTLLRWLDAISQGSGLAQVFDIVSDTPALPGWGKVMSPDDAEAVGLPWLGQFVGLTLDPNMNEQERRDAIKHPVNFERGTIGGMEFLAGLTLTGTKRIDFYERVGGDAWALGVRTYEEETPNPAVTQYALNLMKDVSIVMDYQSIPGLTFQRLKEEYETFEELDETFESFEEMAREF